MMSFFVEIISFVASIVYELLSSHLLLHPLLLCSMQCSHEDSGGWYDGSAVMTMLLMMAVEIR